MGIPNHFVFLRKHSNGHTNRFSFRVNHFAPNAKLFPCQLFCLGYEMVSTETKILFRTEWFPWKLFCLG